MSVWDGSSSGKIQFSGDLGHVIEQKVITGALVDTMREIKNLEVICDKIENISFPNAADPTYIVRSLQILMNSEILSRLTHQLEVYLHVF